MRKVYVINLDRSRIFLVLGFFFLIIGLAILAGYTLSPLKTAEIPATAIPIVKEVEESLVKEKTPVEQGFLAPSEKYSSPNEVEKTENKLDIYAEDPFIKPPPVPKKSPNLLANEKDSFYTIQVGAFVHEKDALRLKERLKQISVEARVEQGSRYWFVRVGKAKEREKLEKIAQKLKAENIEYLIKKIP